MDILYVFVVLFDIQTFPCSEEKPNRGKVSHIRSTNVSELEDYLRRDAQWSCMHNYNDVCLRQIMHKDSTGHTGALL